MVKKNEYKFEETTTTLRHYKKNVEPFYFPNVKHNIYSLKRLFYLHWATIATVENTER